MQKTAKEALRQYGNWLLLDEVVQVFWLERKHFAPPKLSIWEMKP